MSQGYDQSAYTAWVGLCRFDYLPREGAEYGSGDANAHLDQDQVFEAPVAVYTVSAGDFDLVAGTNLQAQGYRFLGSNSPKPVMVWFTEKGPSKALEDLASQVHAHRPFAMGELKAVAYKSQAGDMIEGEKPEPDPLVITEHPITPLPDQTPTWPPDKREWIDEDLKNLLFGQELLPEHQHILKTDKTEAAQADSEGEQNPPLIRTYFIMDATMRRKFTGFFDLDMTFRKRPEGSAEVDGPNGNAGNIEYRSLFKGEVQEELKEVAPYLFDMTLPDGAYDDQNLVPDFHNDFFKSIWDPKTLEKAEGKTHLDTGIFIRTTQDFDTVWRHFRKFTRIQDENGKWYYWRFWDLRMHKNYITNSKALSYVSALFKEEIFSIISNFGGKNICISRLRSSIRNIDVLKSLGRLKLLRKIDEISLENSEHDIQREFIRKALVKMYEKGFRNILHFQEYAKKLSRVNISDADKVSLNIPMYSGYIFFVNLMR